MKNFWLCLAIIFFVPHAVQAKYCSIEKYRNDHPEMPLVYELPADADREGAVEYVRNVRNLAFPKSEVIDAAALSEGELKEKLAGGFFLYTVPGTASRLYNSMKKPPLTFSSGKLQIEGNTYTGNQLRLMLLAANPYSNGQALVCAVSRNAVLTSGVRSGKSSYYVFRGSVTVGEGLYDEDFVFGSEGLTAAEAVADVNQFFSDAEQVHPDLLFKLDEGAYPRLKERTMNAVLSKTGKGGIITARDMAYELYLAAAAFGDGHTAIFYQPLPQREVDAAKYPPFLLEFRNGDFYVSAATDKELVGKRLLSVNGRGVQEFMRPVFDRCSGELFHFKAEKFVRDQQFWWAFSRLFSDLPEFTVEFSTGMGDASKRRLRTVKAEEFGRLMAPSNKEETSLTFLNGGVAYLRYPHFDYTEAERGKIDGIFQEIKSRGARKLLIDIRGNGGGHSGMADFIIKYLTDKPVHSFSMLQLKISQQYIDRWGGELGDDVKALKGLLVTRRLPEKKQEKPKAFYDGKTYLLIDNYTFSSASDFAVMFRDYVGGKMVGYETGGLPSSFGEVFTLQLRNSGISFGVSDKRFISPQNKPGDDVHGVLPDLPATSEVLQKYNTTDPVLSYAADSI